MHACMRFAKLNFLSAVPLKSLLLSYLCLQNAVFILNLPTNAKIN